MATKRKAVKAKMKPWKRKKMYAVLTHEGYMTYGNCGRPYLYENDPKLPTKVTGDIVIPVIVTITEAK